MGKRQRARDRKQAGVSRERPQSADFHITIAALSTTAEIDLRHEIGLVKASLLYADRVTLASPKVLLFVGLAALFGEDTKHRLDAVAEAMSAVEGGEEILRLYRTLERKSKLSPQDRELKARLKMMIGQTGDLLARVIDETYEQAGALELIRAFEAGVVDVDPLGATAENQHELFDTVVEHLERRLGELVAESQTSYPLFDDEAGGLLRAMVQEGKVPEPRFQLANQAGIARSFIADLDAFPHATMDVVLDVRERLQGPLVRFRAAVAEASRELDATVIDSSFRRSVEDIYTRIVAPTVLELEESLDDLRARPTLQRGWPTTAHSVLALLAAGAIGAPGLTQLAALGAGASIAVARELTHRDEVAREQGKNRFFFLYEANRQLASAP